MKEQLRGSTSSFFSPPPAPPHPLTLSPHLLLFLLPHFSFTCSTSPFPISLKPPSCLPPFLPPLPLPPPFPHLPPYLTPPPPVLPLDTSYGESAHRLCGYMCLDSASQSQADAFKLAFDLLPNSKVRRVLCPLVVSETCPLTHQRTKPSQTQHN